MDDLYIKDSVENFDVIGWFQKSGKVIYTEDAVSKIPANVTLNYENNCNKAEYENPGKAFIVDDRYGLYSLEETSDGMTMTIYAMSYVDVYTNGTEEGYEETNSVSMQILDDYTYTEFVDGMEEIYYCDKVVFAKDAIPTSYKEMVWSGDFSGQEVEFTVDEITIYPDVVDNRDFYFDMSNHAGMKVFNASNVGVNFTNANNNELWVRWNALVNNELAEISEIKDQIDNCGNTYHYVKAGETHIITPNNTAEIEYTIYDVMLGDWVEGDMGIEYNRFAGLDHITYYVDGTVEFTIPNFSCDLAYSVEPIGVVEDLSSITIDKAPVVTDSETGVNWYESVFTIGKTDFEICDVTTNTSGTWADDVTVSEEGEHHKSYYVIDRTMNEDGITPSSTYGKISSINYSYVLDLATPTITSVTATDANGKTMSLDYDWVENFDSVSAETAWTNAPSVTVKVTADRGRGSAIAGYMFDGSNWQTSDTYVYTGEGAHDVIIHVRDDFDVKLEGDDKTRPEAGVMVTSIGIDTTAPKLMFTDAKTPTSAELKADTQYEGNLHVVCDDGAGSGLAEINIYKKTGNQWITSNELLVATEEGFYIAPNTQNEVYKIEVIDNAGNETLYDNITVLGYTQDVEVTIGESTGVYGEDLEVEVTIKNTSDNTLSISLFGLREDATDDVFAMEIDSVTELAAGKSFTTKIRLPKGAAAASYEAMLDMTYTNMEEDVGQQITKAYSKQVVATVNRANGTGSVVVEDIYFGQTVSPTATSDTNGTENVTYYYKKADAADSTYTTEVPTATGTYKVKAVFAETANYKEVVAEDEFTITRISATTRMYSITEPNEDGIYEESVVIRGLNGHQLAVSESGVYREQITLSESVGFFRFYIKTPEGAITDAVVLRDIVIELEVPPTPILAGRAHLDTGAAYELGEGTWNVSGDSTNYVGGTVFYVPESGDYEFTQQEGGQ